MMVGGHMLRDHLSSSISLPFHPFVLNWRSSSNLQKPMLPSVFHKISATTILLQLLRVDISTTVLGHLPHQKTWAGVVYDFEWRLGGAFVVFMICLRVVSKWTATYLPTTTGACGGWRWRIQALTVVGRVIRCAIAIRKSANILINRNRMIKNTKTPSP